MAVYDMQGMTIEERGHQLSGDTTPMSGVSLWSCSGSSSASFFACHD